MQTGSTHRPSGAKLNDPMPTDGNLMPWIAAQAHKHGPVFRLAAVRPTYVLSGIDALTAMDDPNLVERSPSVIPARLALILADDDAALLSSIGGAEHERRRSSWLAPGGLDRAGILEALPALEQTIAASLAQWESRGIFSLNLEARRAVWRIASRLVMGHEGSERTLSDFETLIDSNAHAEQVAAKRRIVDWLTQEADQYEPGGHRQDRAPCIAARLAASGQLSKAELINEMKHGIVAAFGLWLPVAEVLRQLGVDSTLAATVRDEVGALAGKLSPSGMARTPRLMGLVQEALRITAPLPVVYAQAKVAFRLEGVLIPADAVLIGALHATNHLGANHGATDGQNDPANVTFGVGQHACPAADMMTMALWLFGAKLLASHGMAVVDPTDLPVQQPQGFFAPRGCFVQFFRVATEKEPAPNRPITDGCHGALAATTPSPAPSVDPASRIAIVGAGITGLTVAHELRKRGFKNITVFERAPSIGGKADTVTIEGRPYNLGAHLCHGSLGVAALAADVGVSLERAPTYELWDIDQNQPIPRSYEHYLQVEKLRQLLAAHPDLEHATGFAATESWTYSSILSWLDAHGLGALREIGPFFTGAGYGFLHEDVPAAFFLKFAQHMTAEGWTPTGGYKHLLARVGEGLDVRCDTEVVTIERRPSSTGPGAATHPSATIHITTRSGTINHDVFDQLFLTGPLEHAGQYLDLSDEEKALFPRIKSHDYYTVLATLDIAQPHAPGLYIVPKNTNSSGNKGHTTAFERAFDDSHVYHFFCYGEPGQSEASILENVRADARKLGGEIAQVHVFQKWAYAPQVSPHDMALGFHRRLDRMQGSLNTYYAGSLLAFELTDHNVLQAKSLVERFFGAQPNAVAAVAKNPPHAQPIQPKVCLNPASDPLSRLPETGTRSILDILRERYHQTPDAILSTYLDAKGKPVRALSYRVLVDQAMACAVSLRDKGVKPGDRVALVYPPDTDEFLIGFFGCLCANAIAVPVACPDPRKLDVEIPRFAHLMADCDCRVALTTRVYSAIALMGRAWNRITNLGADRKITWPQLTWISTDSLSPLAPTAHNPIPSPAPDTVAYLQYTSGSTSDPKGVMVNHANVLHNVNAIRLQTRVSAHSVLVGWVPLFHDMGLVGGPLTALYCGAHMVFFSPISFLQNPALWVHAMSRYRATHTESPNFGYEFLLRHLENVSLDGIDLSSLAHALFGGEAMRHRTFERLAERLHCTGFRAQAMTNIFGAAEATLFLAGGGPGITPLLSVTTRPLESDRLAIPQSPDSRTTTTLIGCGLPPADSDLRIVDPTSTRLLPERAVGEIWLSSPSVSQGYWGRSPEENASVFRARVAGDPAPLRTYLRTGDLGFMERDVLYICGRLKEMMIFSGRNIHPMDIEICVMNAHPAIRQGCVVAFSVEDQEQERLVIVAEVKASALGHAAAAATAIARELADQHQLTCKAVVLVRSGSLPKTSSGKLQRYRARALYLANGLDLVHAEVPDQPTSATPGASQNTDSTESTDTLDALQNEPFTGDVSATRQWLKRLIAAYLQCAPDAISTSTPLSLFGVDSIQALSMTSRISTFVGYRLAPSGLYEHPTIDMLALHLCTQTGPQDRSLVQLQHGDVDQFPRLFCVHPVGGSAMAYLGLVERLPDPIPVYAFGNETSAAPADDLVEMARHYVAEMRAVQPTGPYYLLGYSFGGTVAYEMARQILAFGQAIGGLYVIDSLAPLYRDHAAGPKTPELATYSNFLETAILNHLIPDQLDDDEREKLRLRIDQNQRALARYRIDPKDRVRPKMVIFRASQEAPHLRDSARHPAFDRPDFGWDEAAPGSVLEILHAQGDHFSIMNAPTAIANRLVSLLSGEAAGPLPPGSEAPARLDQTFNRATDAEPELAQ